MKNLSYSELQNIPPNSARLWGDYVVHSNNSFYCVNNSSVIHDDPTAVPMFGWKFHIGIDDRPDTDGKKNNLEKGWNIVSDILIAHGVKEFKIVRADQDFYQVKEMDGEIIDQRGKQLTIYSYLDPRDQDTFFWKKVLQDIETALRLNNITPNMPDNTHEFSVAGSEYIRYRNDARYHGGEEGDDEYYELVENRTTNPNPSNLLNPYENIRLHPPGLEDHVIHYLTPCINSIASACVSCWAILPTQFFQSNTGMSEHLLSANHSGSANLSSHGRENHLPEGNGSAIPSINAGRNAFSSASLLNATRHHISQDHTHHSMSDHSFMQTSSSHEKERQLSPSTDLMQRETKPDSDQLHL